VSDVKVNKSNKDQMFFHDLINQTHGLLLFLESKHSLDTSEINLLKNEIKLLQGLAQDHYQLNHKNLPVPETAEDQEEKIKSELKKLVSLYFPKYENSIQINISGSSQGTLDFVSLYRIMNNIVKNMAESSAREAIISLDFTPKGLNFTTENSIGDKNVFTSSQGLGLLSVATIAKDSNGLFQYEIHQSTWKNLIFLPYQSIVPIKKIAA
jgi:hypothetical protein